MSGWSAAYLPSQEGRTWLVTGATSGIGRATVWAASRAGATVVLAVRDVTKGQAVAASLPAPASVVELDLGSLASVRRAAEATPEVDVLVNNAGRITTSRQVTDDGFECLIGTNALGPFAYTNLVAGKVHDRVVIVGSGAHRSGVLDLVDPYFERGRRWTAAAAYAQSKLADMVWGLGLSRRLSIGVQLCHPGWAATGISRATASETVNRVATWGNGLVGQSPERGALPTLYAASQDLPSCSYTGPDGRFEFRGYPTLVGRSTEASDPRLADRYWRFAVDATGTDLPSS